jgi:hypothetical protein
MDNVIGLLDVGDTEPVKLLSDTDILLIIIMKQTRLISNSRRLFTMQNAENAQAEKADFLKRWERLMPPAHELFDKKMKVYGMQDNYFLINHYWIPGSVIVFPQ